MGPTLTGGNSHDKPYSPANEREHAFSLLAFEIDLLIPAAFLVYRKKVLAAVFNLQRRPSRDQETMLFG
jgi:hypothetical protein